jgi:hypothetical protein
MPSKARLKAKNILGIAEGGTGATSMGAGAVGAVTQSAGIPTGAIVESGSNANGNYIKYADGTMICTRVVSGTYNVNNAFGSLWYANIASQAFAATFIAVPICNVASVYGIGAVMWGAGTLATTTGSGGLTIISASSFASAALTISLVAIGRWF